MSPTRRDIIAGVTVPLAADLAPLLRKVPADADAKLLALREPYERTLALMEHFAGPHSRAEDAYLALRIASPDSDARAFRKRSGLTIAERDYNRVTRANVKAIDRIAETPARTLAGVVFKAEVSRREDDMDLALLRSIVTDLLAMELSQAGTRPTANSMLGPHID